MKTTEKIRDIREQLEKERVAGKTIGLVPTMGFFHAGHVALIRRARAECDVVVVTLFVNPLQFGPNEDLRDYPRDLERDTKVAREEAVDYLFAPSKEEMYPNRPLTSVQVAAITDKLCGRSRPGHFTGVATVCAKLFNIVKPDRAYFGEKDFQQLKVVEALVRDLNFDITIVAVPTVREHDGLALSSRNIYLDAAERKAARVLPQALFLAERTVSEGGRDAESLKQAVRSLIKEEDLLDLEYLSVCDPETLEEVPALRGPALLAIAARIGRTRLIDSIVLEPAGTIGNSKLKVKNEKRHVKT